MINQITIFQIQHKVAELSVLFRKKHNLSQSELAKHLCMSRSAIQKLEKGENITMTTFLLLLQHFDLKDDFVSFLDTLTESGEMPNLYADEK